MLYPELEERLHHTKRALDKATTENIVDRCKQYLALLDEYRSALYRLPRTLELKSSRESSSSGDEISDTRKAVRTAIEHTTQERNRAEALLLSFTAVSGYEATATLNRLKYDGHDNWELRAGGVRWGDDNDNKMTVQEAVEAVSLLRREEYIATQDAPHELHTLTGRETRTGD